MQCDFLARGTRARCTTEATVRLRCTRCGNQCCLCAMHRNFVTPQLLCSCKHAPQVDILVAAGATGGGAAAGGGGVAVAAAAAAGGGAGGGTGAAGLQPPSVVQAAAAAAAAGTVASAVAAGSLSASAAPVRVPTADERRLAWVRQQMDQLKAAPVVDLVNVGVTFRTDGGGAPHVDHDCQAIRLLNAMVDKNGKRVFPFTIAPVSLPRGAAGAASPPRVPVWSDLDGIHLLYIPGGTTANDTQEASSAEAAKRAEEAEFMRLIAPKMPAAVAAAMATTAAAGKSVAAGTSVAAGKSVAAGTSAAVGTSAAAGTTVATGASAGGVPPLSKAAKQALKAYQEALAGYQRKLKEHTDRAAYELRLISIARERGIPVLAVCAGSWRLLENYGGKVRALDISQRALHRVQGAGQWLLENRLNLVGSSTLQRLRQPGKWGGDGKWGEDSKSLTMVTGANSTHWAVASTVQAGTAAVGSGSSATASSAAAGSSAMGSSLDVKGASMASSAMGTAGATLATGSAATGSGTPLASAGVATFTLAGASAAGAGAGTVVLAPGPGKGEPAKLLAISAMDMDTNTVEAYEALYGAPTLGIQWHPEGHLQGMPGEATGSEEVRMLGRALFELMGYAAQTAKRRHAVALMLPLECQAFGLLCDAARAMALNRWVTSDNFYEGAVGILPVAHWSMRMRAVNGVLDLLRDAYVESEAGNRAQAELMRRKARELIARYGVKL